MKRNIFSLVVILTFILSIGIVLVACEENTDDNQQNTISVSMTFNMDGVDYTYELTDTGEDQTFNVKYETNTIEYDVIKIGEHYYVCNGVADFVIENGELKIYSIGNAIDFITPRSYHVGTHNIDGQSVTLQEDGTFVTESGNKKYYVVDGNKLIVPNDNGSGVVYTKTMGGYVKAGTFYGDLVIYPDTEWKAYEFDNFIDFNVEKSFAFGSTYGKYFVKGDNGESEWYYGTVTVDDTYVTLICGEDQKKFVIDYENKEFDDAYKMVASGDKKLKIYESGKVVFRDIATGVTLIGEEEKFNDEYITIKYDNTDEFIRYVYDKELNLVISVYGDYEGLPSGTKEVVLKGSEKEKFYFFEKGTEKFAYIPEGEFHTIFKYRTANTDERVYEMEDDSRRFKAFVDGEYIYMYSEVSIERIDNVKSELATVTEVMEKKWNYNNVEDIFKGIIELSTYVVEGQEKCVLFIYEPIPRTSAQFSSVSQKALVCGNYTVTTEGNIIEYVVNNNNETYTIRVQNNEILSVEYTFVE